MKKKNSIFKSQVWLFSRKKKKKKKVSSEIAILNGKPIRLSSPFKLAYKYFEITSQGSHTSD